VVANIVLSKDMPGGVVGVLKNSLDLGQFYQLKTFIFDGISFRLW
jgi:hypothetical protein